MLSSICNLKCIFGFIAIGGILAGCAYAFDLKEIIIPSIKKDESAIPGESDVAGEGDDTGELENKNTEDTSKAEETEEVVNKQVAEKTVAQTKATNDNGKITVVFSEEDKGLFDSGGKLQLTRDNIATMLPKLNKLADAIIEALKQQTPKQ